MRPFREDHFLTSSSRTYYLIVRKDVLLQLYSEPILNQTMGLVLSSTMKSKTLDTTCKVLSS